MASKCLANPTSGPWSKPTDMLCCWNASDILRLSWLNLWWDCCTAVVSICRENLGRAFNGAVDLGPFIVCQLTCASIRYATRVETWNDLEGIYCEGSTSLRGHSDCRFCMVSWITQIYKDLQRLHDGPGIPTVTGITAAQSTSSWWPAAVARSGGRSPFIPTKVIHQHSVQSRGDASRIDVNTQRLKYLDTMKYHEITQVALRFLKQEQIPGGWRRKWRNTENIAWNIVDMWDVATSDSSTPIWANFVYISNGKPNKSFPLA